MVAGAIAVVSPVSAVLAQPDSTIVQPALGTLPDVKLRRYGGLVEFQVLGPVVGHEIGREFKLGGPKQRLVLAMLLAARGETVSTGTLMDGLWQDSAPQTARKTLQGYVHHLRSEVGDDLRTDNAGYSLQLDDDQVDERRFCTMLERARRLVHSEPDEVSVQLTDALDLWKGHPYADLSGELVLQPEIARLEELRLVALGDRIDADLALGRHETLIGELESLIAENPLIERFRGQQMLALYRSGRHGEALRVYARTRDHYVAEMGIEPSSELLALEEQILARDPALLHDEIEETEPQCALFAATNSGRASAPVVTAPHCSAGISGR